MNIKRLGDKARNLHSDIHYTLIGFSLISDCWDEANVLLVFVDEFDIQDVVSTTGYAFDNDWRWLESDD